MNEWPQQQYRKVQFFFLDFGWKVEEGDLNISRYSLSSLVGAGGSAVCTLFIKYSDRLNPECAEWVWSQKINQCQWNKNPLRSPASQPAAPSNQFGIFGFSFSHSEHGNYIQIGAGVTRAGHGRHPQLCITESFEGNISHFISINNFPFLFTREVSLDRN